MSTAYPPIVDRPVRWGLLGAGSIAPALVRAVASTSGGEVVAVAARDGARAQAFADEHGVPRAWGSYAELLADDGVDVVYISSTHPHHAAQALDCLAAGKHVLVEKPITLTVRDTEAVLDRARARGLFAMEAMWTRCLPLVRELLGRVRSGELGQVRSVFAAFTVPFGYDESHRLFDLANGGGALMDLGVYPVTLAHLLAGHPTDVQVIGSTVPTGADDQVGLQWRSEDGVLVQVLCDSQSHGASRTVVRGTGGWIEVHGPVNDPESFTVHRAGDGPEQVTGERRGFVHQVQEVHRCLREGLVESPLVPHEASVAVMTVLESVRHELGVRYPQEEELRRA
ncbi:Gfo/Idh/MocA family protein [Ornithinimicrobium avium]|uniref:Gfo/Idh/MocA family protein n=1 Tax=Ornithinimicrobium avium TaxID=2283195 RepID=UPI0013B475E6|nr:Gfo/Idh/MocA family oxidoreductase [Ornithinimicrobium avium]